jgi:uncharacterized protein (DUF362 family)
MAVYVQKVAAYDPGLIRAAFENGLQGLSIDLSGKRTAFLKPNLVRASRPNTAIVTHPVVVEGLIDALQAHGITDITVGELSSIGVDTMHAFDVAGYAEMAKRKGVRLVDLSTLPAKPVPWKYGLVDLPQDAVDADIYISVPKLKTHCHATVTLGTKNQWALLPYKIRQQGHQQNLHEYLVELGKAISPHITVVDGIEGMEGLGPTNGRKSQSRVLIMGDKLFETDAACCRLIGIDPHTSKHLQIAYDQGLWHDDPEFIGAVPRVAAFEPPDPGPRKKLNLYAWRNDKTCALAEHVFEEAVHEAMHNPRYWPTFMPKFLGHVLFGRLDYVRGPNPPIPDEHGAVLWLCDCSKQYISNNGTVAVHGCPPKTEDVIRAISKMPITRPHRKQAV